MQQNDKYQSPINKHTKEYEKEKFEKIMLDMETPLGPDGISWSMPEGTESELEELQSSYQHLCKLRNEVIAMGILPPLKNWSSETPNL